MHTLKPKILAAIAAIAAVMLGFCGPLYADSSDSMYVGDLQYGNGLDPNGWLATMNPDPRGFSWLHAGMLRTPSGVLYPYPPRRDTDTRADDQWIHWGVLQLGYLSVGGNDQAQFFRQYDDWRDGLVLGLLSLNLENPHTGSYAEIRASRLSGDDQYLRVRAGKLGKYKVQAFYRDMPHAVATDAYPLWQGVGSTHVTLPAPLVPGASNPADVAAAAAQAPRKTIGFVRTREGLRLEGEVYKHWYAYGGVTNEERNGTRLWGGPMFFNFPFKGDGGALETVRPIDFSTTDVNFGLRYVGTRWHFNAVYTGSFFRDHKNKLDFDSPFALYNVVGTPNVGNIAFGEFSLEPDNDFHNLRLELSRSLQWNGELSMAAAWGSMRQNDALLAPVTCTGKGGIFIAPPADFTFNCADWNTTAALSQKSANARIDTGLLYAKATFRPSRTFGWHAQLRWYQEDNKTDYLSFNPLTNQYGYISENGAQGTVVPGETGIFDPRNPLYWSYNTQIRNTPFSYKDAKFELGGDWQVGNRRSFSATYLFDHYQPQYRERKRVDEQRLKLAWVDRNLGNGTLRLSYEHARRDGDKYNYDPYAAFYSKSLPGFVMPPNGLPAFTVDAMRKYDLSDRTEDKALAIFIYPLGTTATISTTLHALHDDYGAQIGRQDAKSVGATVEWDWQPSPLTNVSANAGFENARTRLSNVADNEAIIGADPGQQDPSFGGPLYPLANQWWDHDRERNLNAGFTWAHSFAKVRVDASYNLTWSISQMHYDYASVTALSGTQQPFVGTVGNGFPDNHFRIHSLNLGANWTLTPRVGMRLFGRFDRGSFFDWHYAGLADTPVIDHRIYTDRGPQLRYHASLVGVLFNVKL